MALSVGGWRFRPHWWWLAFALAGAIAFIALGNWQLRRAEGRHALAAAHQAALKAPPVALPGQPIDASAYALRRVTVRGTFVPARTVYLDNRLRQGRVGYEVVTPMRIEGSALYVVVMRGWVAAGRTRDDVPQISTPAGVLRIEGVALAGIPQRFEPKGAQPEGQRWQNLSVDRFRAATGLALQPVMIEQHSEINDGLSRDWPQRGSGAEKNENYALQWYSLAALAVILWLVLSFRRDAYSS